MGQQDTLEADRVLSIDIFRGLVILAMIFVNDVAGVRNVPSWLKHAPAEADTMTFPDLVFPAFLLIVGMSIPFAIQARLNRAETTLQLWRHILTRTIGLLVFGVFMVNTEGGYDEQAMGMRMATWALLMYASAILIWNKYPRAVGMKRAVYSGLRITGAAGLVILYLIYRDRDGNMMGPRWWGILGLIGWAYLISCALYLGFRKQMPAMIGCLTILIAFCLGIKSGKLELHPSLQFLYGQAGNAAHSIMVISGIIVSLLLFENSPAKTPNERIVWMVAFAALLLLAGFLLRPLHGISKIHATPTWSLYCSAIGVLVYAPLYWVVDVKNMTGWTRFLRPIGSNPLLAYILPAIVYFLLAWLHASILPDYFEQGVMGIVRSCVFTILMLGLASWMTKLNLRLHV